MPSRTSVTRHVDQIFETSAATISKNLKACRASAYSPTHVSITFDTWTSRSRRGHLGINAFVIDKDFTLHSLSLCCVSFPYPHTAERTADLVLSSLATYSVASSDLMAVTTDNESAVVAAARKVTGADEGKQILQLSSLAVSTTCACNSLNLCGETATRVSSFDDVFKHLTDVTAFFAYPKRGEIMDKKLTELHLPVRRFNAAAPTRWNYTAQCVQRSVDNAPAVVQLTCADLDIQGTKEKEEWDTLRVRYRR